MLDDVGLIHMNGRLYDPFLGRFCAADPFVQSPNNIQNYNRYTYVLNNPLSLVDPSGHFFGIIFAIGAAIAGAVSAIVGAILSVLSAVLVAAAKVIAAAVKFTMAVLSKSAAWIKAVGSKLVTAVKAGWSQGVANYLSAESVRAAAGMGAARNAISTIRHGGSLSDVLRSMATGAAISVVFAVNGAFMHHLSTLDGLGAKITHFAAHGISGGAMSVANGGSFKDGFVGGLAGNALSVLTPNLGGSRLAGVALRTSLAAVAGGAASSMRGGSFVDGAYSAAFNHLYNAEGGKLALKGAQQALRGLGYVPGIGMAADLASAGISFYTGDYIGGVIDLVSVVPGVGDGAGTALRVAYEGYGAAKWAGKTLGKAADGAPQLALPFKPSWTGVVQPYQKGAMTPIEHIFYRHGPESGFTKGAGKFAEGIGAREIKAMVDEAATFGKVTFQPSGRGGIVYDFGRQIGTHMDGSAASRLQVFFNEAGEVMTAYPMK